MRIRAAVVAALAAVLLQGGTAYADGAPVAGIAYGGQGVQWGSLRFVALPAGDGTAVAQIDASSGTVNSFMSLKGAWGIPQVAFDGTTAGVSAGGEALVLAQTTPVLNAKRTRFVIVNPLKMRGTRIVTLHGAFYFDAISPDGGAMYLIQLTSPWNALHYTVRAFDLRHGRLVPGAIVDRTEPDERMAGLPMSRATTPDGAWAYTLYEKPSGRYFVHALNTQAGVARCIDLPRLSSQNMPRLSIDGGRLDVVSEGRVLAAVDRATLAVTRSPAPVARTAARPAPARHSSSRAPLWVAIPAGLFLAGLAAFALRRRRPARARSGGAAAGAPSGP